VAGETFTIVQASNAGTSYANVKATANSFYVDTSSIASGSFDDLILTVTNTPPSSGIGNGSYTSVGQAAGAGIAPAIGSVLDKIEANILGGGDASFAPILTALNTLGQQSQAAEQLGIKQLAPSQVEPQLASSNFLINQGADVVAQHQELFVLQHGTQATGMAAGSEYHRGLFWGQVSGGYSSQGSTAAMGGYGQSSYGLTAGIDLFVTKTTSLGLAFGWMHGNAFGADSLSGTDVSTDSYQLTGYGSHRMGPAFVNAMLGLGYNGFEQSRNIGFLGATARANYGGLEYMSRIDGGWDFPVVNQTTTLTPIIGFQAVRTDNSSYSESGAGAADLSVGREIVNSYATTAGVKFTTAVMTQWGNLIPEVKVQWVHDLENSPIPTVGLLGGVNFTTMTPRVAPDGAQTTLGLTIQKSDTFALRVEYDGDWRNNYSSNTGLLKASWNY
jgi:outer membrane autotransporter protein